MVALRMRTGQSAPVIRRSAPPKLPGRIGTYRSQLLKVLGMQKLDLRGLMSLSWAPLREDVIAGNGESGLDRGINTPCPALCCSLPLSLSERIKLCHCHIKSIHELPNYPTIRCRHHSKWRTPAVTAATTIPSRRPASWAAMPSTSRASERYPSQLP